MCDCQYDLTYYDFNPTVYFASKTKMTNDGICHAHEDLTELTFILSGKGRYTIEDKVYDVEAGDMLICNKGVQHRNIVTNPEEPTVEFFTGFSDYHFKNMPQNAIVLADGRHVLHLGAEAKREVSRICFEMLAENASNQLGKYFMLKAHLMQILLHVMRELLEPPVLRQKGYNLEIYNTSYAVKRIILYLTENYEHKISLDQIAHNMYLSPVYISKIFKKETGESPINYLIKIRLEKAKEILENSKNGSIKSIANTVGYEDVYHFSKLFKKYYGISPLHYRKTWIDKV